MEYILPPSGPPVVAVDAPAGPRRARLDARLLAFVLDAAPLATLGVVTALVLAMFWEGPRDSGGYPTGLPAYLAGGLTLLTGFLYFWLSEGRSGATAGKLIAGIRVCKADGQACDLRASLIRNLLRLVDVLGFLMALRSVKRQRIGDEFARTLVVHDETAPAARGRIAALWLALIAFGCASSFLAHRQYTGALRIRDLRFQQAGGRPGGTVSIRYDVRGHALSPSGAADLTVTTATLASNGAPLHRPRADHFLGPSNSNGAVGGSFTVRLPDWAPLGIYRIRIGLHDNLRPALSEVVLRFAVEDRSLAAAASLEIRDFQLSSIRDGPPLPVSGPLLYGGGALYLRLRLFGVRFQGDQVKVRIGARLTGPGGNVVLDRPDWMEIGDRYEGHPANFFLPVRGELAAPADLEKGIHTATFTFTDGFSSATVARQARFEAAPGG